jgi:hypothetical protein
LRSKSRTRSGSWRAQAGDEASWRERKRTACAAGRRLEAHLLKATEETGEGLVRLQGELLRLLILLDVCHRGGKIWDLARKKITLPSTQRENGPRDRRFLRALEDCLLPPARTPVSLSVLVRKGECARAPRIT